MTIDKNESAKVPTFFSDEQAGRLILHNLQDSFILVNAQLAVVYCNQAARKNVRHFLGVEIFPGMSILNLAPEHRWPFLREIFASVMLGNQHATEVQFTDNNRQVYYENTFSPAYNADGVIAGIIVCSKDISERRKAQQTILDSEQRLQFALEAGAQGAWDWNLQTNEVIYSSSYKKLYGFEENDLKNHVSEWMTRIHPDDQPKMEISVQQHLGSGDQEYDSRYRIRAKDGSYRWVMARGRLIEFDPDGKPLRMIGTHTDITEAVIREEALQLINERFDCMMKATHELLWEWDIVRNIVFRAKDGIKTVYGIADDSTILTIDNWLQRVHAEDQPKIRGILSAIMKAAHHQTFELEYRFRREDGTYADIYDRCILIRNAEDQPVRLIGAAQDVSERKQLQKDLLQAELGYQRLLYQATVDSQEKERAEIGKELHDNVNQVLTTTKLYLDLATTDAAMRDALIRKSLNNINEVITEIRHLSRSLMDPSIGDLGLLASIDDLIGNIHLTKQLQIELDAEEAVEELLDANQKLTIFRIIQESLNNVLRHAKASKVQISIRLLNGQVLLTIRDNGVGFGAGVTKKGAGLKNIQNRIYLIDGTLDVKSHPGEGCTIQLQFPIKQHN
jgi:PAS domain S-box-containing protein